jgi:DNA-binding SARP family transcriptional activator
MKVCQIAETPEFKKLEKAVGFFEAVRDWKENNFIVRDPETVKNKLVERQVKEDRILSSTLEGTPVLKFQDNKDLYKKYNLTNKTGQLKVIPYTSIDQVNAAHRWLKTLNQSPDYSFKLITGVNSAKHIIIRGKSEGQGILFSGDPDSALYKPDPNVREKYFSTGDIQSMSSLLGEIAKRDIPLSKLAAYLQKYAEINDVSVVLAAEEFFTVQDGPKRSNGYYDGSSNYIKLAEFSPFKNKNGFETLVLHEALHALSFRALQKNNDFTNAFRELYEESIKQLGTYDIETATGPYGNFTIDEFYVALFTDSKFIKSLQKLAPVKSKKFDNLFEEIMDYILGILGLEKNTSLYTQSFEVASQILNEQVGEYKKGEEYNQMMRETMEALDNFDAAKDDVVSAFRTLSIDENQYSLLDESLTLDPEQTKKNRGMEIANKLAQTLSLRLGIKANVITESDAISILEARGKQYNGEKGFFTRGEVYLVGDRITTELVFHEFAHPIIRAMASSNNALFQNLYNQLSETTEGQSLIDAVRANYPELEETSDLFKEEVLVFALSRKADNTLRNIPETNSFVKWVKDLLYAIKQFFRKDVFKGKTIKIEDLDATTTLDQLANMLANDEFKIDIQSVSDQDGVSFSKEFRQEIIDHLKSLESEDAQKITKDFVDSTNKVFKYLGTYNYKELREVLKDPMGRSDVKEILSNLNDFVESSGLEFENTEEALKYINVRSANLINSLYKLEGSAKKILQHYKELAADTDNKNNLSKIYYYNNIIKEWMIFLDQSKRTLNNDIYDGKIESNNPLVNLIDSISNTFAKTKPYSEKVLSDGATDTLTDELMSMTGNIDKMYTDLIEFYEKKGAPKKFIDRYKYEYEQVKLSPEKIKSLIKGELGDAHPLNFFFEGYMHNQDPVVFGFAKYVKNNYIGMNSEVQENFIRFSNEIDPLLEKAGYGTNAQRLTGVFKDLAFWDRKRTKKDGDDLSYATFLNPFKDFYYDRSNLQKKVKEAQAKYDTDKTDESLTALRDADHELEKFDITYMTRENTPEFYERFDMLKDDIGKEADRRMKTILNEIQGLQSNLNSIEQQMENNDTLDELWRQYKLLGSMVNLDGTSKTSFEKDVAERISEYKSATRKLYEWKPRLGLFENKYISFLQGLEDEGITPTGKTSKEYNRRKKDWLDQNTVVKYSDAFYKDTGEIFAKMAELAEDSLEQKELADLFEQRNNLISSYKDENGHPSGLLMSEDVLRKVKSIDEKIKDTFEKAVVKLGISQGDWNAYMYYEETIEDFISSGASDITGTNGLSVDQWKDYTNIKNKLKASGKTKEEAAKIIKRAQLLKDLTNIQRKSPTQDYIDEVNSRMNQAAKEHAKKRIGTDVFGRSDIKYVTNETFVREIAALDPEFKKWFDENHTSKSYKRKGKDVTYYTPTAAWTYREPKNPKYYEKTVIKDEDGNEIETLSLVPKLSYFYRSIKPEYKTVKRTMLDCIREGIGLENATIDMQGRPLPKYNISDTKYINQDFFTLQNNSPDKYNLLIALIKNQLETQEKYVSIDSRLNLEIPRYEAESFELGIQTRISDGKNALSRWAQKVKNLFAAAPDDFEEGLNPEQKQIVNKMDLFDEDYVNVPITGTYDIDQKVMSKDIMRSMMRHMQSGVKQKTLINMLPMAKALQALVNDPDNNPDRVIDGVKQYSKQKLLTNTLFHTNTPKGTSIRAQAINAFIEREFEGKSQAGYTKDMTTVNKIVNGMFGWASKAYFSFNIPSALKNSLGLRFQSMIEAAAGGFFNMKDYTAGSMWAAKVVFEYTGQNYKLGDKSLNLQLVQMMDPDQGRFKKEITKGTGTTRSIMSDAVNLEFMTSVRKMTELNANLSIFGAMLKKSLIERTMPDGSTSKITYDQAWEVVDGVIKLKSGIDKSWDKDGKNFKSFVSKVHGIINNMNGAYADFDQPNANRFLTYRFFMFMKNYFVPMFMNRWGHKWDKQRKLFMHRYDANLDTMTKGYYIETLQFLGKTLKDLGRNIPYMNDQEKMAVKKTLAEVGLLTIIGVLVVGVLFGYDSDDEDRYEKLRKKSGPLPIFGAGDEQNPFVLNGWLSNHLLGLAIAVRQENESWLPVPYMGLDDYNGMLKVEGAALKTTVTSYVRILEDVVDLVKGDPSARYKREVGPLPWQQEGGLKIASHAAKMIGITGKITEPIVGLKSTESFETFNK